MKENDGRRRYFYYHLSMKFNSRTFFIIFAWVVTLVIGILVGRQITPAQEAPESEALARFYQRSGQGASASGDSDSANQRRASGESRVASSGKISLNGSSSDRINQAFAYLTEISTINDPIERNRQLIQLIDQMDASQYQGVIEKSREEGLMEDNRGEYSMLLHGWVKQDPVAATDYVANSESDDWAKETVIAAWAAKDPASAAEMVNNLEDGGEINNWIVGLARGIARTDPAAAMLTLQGLPVSRTRGAAINNVIPAVAEKGTEYALTWLENVEDESLRRYSASHLASQLTRRDPVEASKWAASISDTDSRRHAAQEVTQRWVYQDLDAARTWVESLPQDTKTEAAEGVARRLGQVDPAEGARWLNGLGDDPDYDGARIRYAREATRRDPQQALAVIVKISDQGQQTRYYNDALGRWARKDKAATTNWIINNSAQIPEAIVRRFVPQK